MKVFRKEKAAVKSKLRKETFYLNGACPYRSDHALCGNWCALFYFHQGEKTRNRNTSPHVILGCKAGEKLLCVNELVED